MDSSGLSSIMKGIGGCVVGYEFTCFVHKYKLLYTNISNDSPYFGCPDKERFYPFEI